MSVATPGFGPQRWKYLRVPLKIRKEHHDPGSGAADLTGGNHFHGHFTSFSSSIFNYSNLSFLPSFSPHLSTIYKL